MPRLLLWGVVPSLVAAAALMLPPRHGLFILWLMLLCYAVDRRVCPAHGLQAWLSLRLRLSLVAATSCLVAAAGG